jgi:hypothetical protein
MGEPPEFTPTYARTVSFEYMWERLAPMPELVVRYYEFGELTYRRNGSWGMESYRSEVRILTSRASAHIRWPQNLDPERSFRLLPNQVVQWLWQRVSLASIRRQRVTLRGLHNDRNRYGTCYTDHLEACFWRDRQTRMWVFVRVLECSVDDQPYYVFEGRIGTNENHIFEPLVFSMDRRRWLVQGPTGFNDFVEVPDGVAHWLQVCPPPAR